MDYNEFNFQLEKCKQNIIDILNESKMPIGALLYIVKDIYSELNSQYIASINTYSISHPKKEEKESIDIDIPKNAQIQIEEKQS